jgi:hypothetical protein
LVEIAAPPAASPDEHACRRRQGLTPLLGRPHGASRRPGFYKSYPADGDAKAKQNARRQAFGRALKDAQAKGLIGVREIETVTYVWLATTANA